MNLKSIEAEQALLGAVLMTNHLIERVSVRAEHFCDPVHAVIWEEVTTRYRAGRLADPVSMRDWAAITLEKMGGVKYLLDLHGNAAPLLPQVVEYGEVIRDLARRRSVTQAARIAINEAERGEVDSLSELERRLQEIALLDVDADDWKHKGESIAYAVERAELGEAAGISTGFAKLDEMIGGLKPALYMLGAASSMGKTTLLSAISRNVAAQGLAVAEFMLEMDEMEDGLRSAAALAFKNDHRVLSPHYLSAQRGSLSAEQWAAMRGAAKAAAHLPIYTDWRPGRSVSQMEAAARRLFAKLRREKKAAPGLVVIDHEGLIAAEPGARFSSQLERTNARAEALMALPKRLGVPVLIAGQLTKDGKRADGQERMPSTDDWKYGGALVEAAQAVMLVHRKAYYAERKPPHLRSDEDWRDSKSREATIVVDKARGGRRGQFTILMDMPTAAVWEDAA